MIAPGELGLAVLSRPSFEKAVDDGLLRMRIFLDEISPLVVRARQSCASRTMRPRY
jgi:hypothetical protein